MASFVSKYFQGYCDFWFDFFLLIGDRLISDGDFLGVGGLAGDGEEDCGVGVLTGDGNEHGVFGFVIAGGDEDGVFDFLAGDGDEDWVFVVLTGDGDEDGGFLTVDLLLNCSASFSMQYDFSILFLFISALCSRINIVFCK